LKSRELPPARQFQYAIAAGEEGSVWIGSAGLPLTQVKADGTTKSFPKIHDVTCIRRDRHGTVWVAADRLFQVREGRDPEPFEMQYPQEDSARVLAIAVDRNDELWVTIRPGPTYHMVKGKWRDESDALGKKPGMTAVRYGSDAAVAITAATLRNIWASSKGLIRRC
jgi:hypothetical protein